MALTLWRTKYANIKRNTSRQRPDSKYYCVFDWKNPETGKTEKCRFPLGAGDYVDDRWMERLRDRGYEMMAAHKLPKAEKPKEVTRTLGEALLADLNFRRAGLQQSTITRYELNNKTILETFPADTPIADITSDDLARWILARQQQVSNASVNRDLARIKSVFKYARKRKWIKSNPVDELEIGRLPEPDERVRYLTPDEEQRLWSVCAPWVWRMIWFAANTGLRLGEMLSLTWSQVEGGQIRLKGMKSDGKSATKGKRPRVVPIVEDVQAILDEIATEQGSRKSEGLVFVSRVEKKPIHASNFQRDYWRPALKRAGIKNFRWHDLRHTFCSWIVQGGGQLEKVQELAGHKHLATTKKYSHMAPEHLTETVAILQKRQRPPLHNVTPIGKAR